jgi:hypothetical protein
MGDCLSSPYRPLEPESSKFHVQHQSIQKLSVMVKRLDTVYQYYREQCFINKSKAIAYQEEGHDTPRAIHHVKITKKYEANMNTTNQLQLLLISLQLKLRMAVETAEIMEIIKSETDLLNETLDKIYNETKVIQTLNMLETQLERGAKLQELVNDTAVEITKQDERELEQWCKDRYKILEDFSDKIPKTDNPQNAHGNYYSAVLKRDQEERRQLEAGTASSFLVSLPNLVLDTFFNSTPSPLQDPSGSDPSKGSKEEIVLL